MIEQRSNASELQRIVGINEEIKQIAASALRINVVALNAIVLAAQTGAAARGFGQVSIELRAFSGSLKACMAELSQLTHASVDGVTSLLKMSRLHDILRRAVDDGKAGEHLAPAVRRSEAAFEAGLRQVGAQRSRLAAELERARRLSDLGQALSRSARIEATYGREFAGPLTQLTDDFSEVITRIGESLRIVGKLTRSHAT